MARLFIGDPPSYRLHVALAQNFVVFWPKFHLENSTLRHPNLMKISLKFEAK